MTRPPPVLDAFVAECPTRDLLDRLSSKWVSLILVALSSGPSGHRALHRRIDGVSQKMLTQTLRTLERDGIIARCVIPTNPVRTRYELTVLGRTLLPIMASIKTWAETHLYDVNAARARYDERDLGEAAAD